MKRKLVWIVLGAVWLAVLVLIVVLTATKAVGGKAKRVPVYRVAREDQKIALTFNCAWGDETTDGVLDILKDNGIKATFFFVGTFAEDYPESVRKIVNAGHEPGNHSMRHRDPAGQSAAELRADMAECSDLIFSLTGVKPKLYRAPSGAYTDAAVETAEALGMTAVQWSADSIDWKNPTPAEITARVLKRASPGGIVLFHLGKENTLAALPDVLSALRAQGYEFCTVGELLLNGETFVDEEGVLRIKN